MKKGLIALTMLLCLGGLAACNQTKPSSNSSKSEPEISSIPSESSSQDSKPTSSEPAGGTSSKPSGSSQPVVVSVNAVAISPAKATVYLDAGNTVQFEAFVFPENATDKGIVWESSDTTVATVDTNGLVTCLKEGNARITAKSHENPAIDDFARVTVKNYSSQADTLDSLNVPVYYDKYEANTQTLDNVADIQTKELARTTFFKNEKGTKDHYRVGVDNAFKLGVTGTITDEKGTDTLVNNPHTLLSFYKYDTAQGKYGDKIEGDALNEIVTVNQDNTEVTFDKDVIGDIYKIKVEVDDSKYASHGAGYSPIELEVEVVNGYNVYDKYGLLLYDNVQTAWNTVKAEKGLDGITTDGVVLHGDISVNADDLPNEFKYTEAEIDSYIAAYGSDFSDWCTKKEFTAEQGKACLVGSTKDYVSVFYRDATADVKSFSFEGNYFKIDCSGIKQVYAFNRAVESGEVSKEYSPDDPSKGSDGSHAQLFGFNNEANASGVAGDEFKLRNLTVIGNGDLTKDDKFMGGLITFKFNSVKFIASNVLTSKSFTTFLDEMNSAKIPEGVTTMILDRCKCYDSYNSMIYVWGVENNIITNCVMKRAGGAIALLDEVNASKKHGPDAADYSYGTPKVDCYNVNFDNPVGGDEPWFNAHKATTLVQMMELFGNATEGKWLGRNASLHGDHMNILTVGTNEQGQPTPFLNLIAIDIDGRSPLTNSLATGGSMLEGHFNVYNDANFTQLLAGIDLAKMAAADPTLEQAQFVGQVVQEALVNGNYLPTYRLIAANAGAQSIVAATNAGHVMLYDGETFNNGIIAAYNDSTHPGGETPIAEGVKLTPIPLYADNSGTGAEVAYNLGETYKPNLNGLATGPYISMYLQPAAGMEYLGAFIKMQQIGA